MSEPVVIALDPEVLKLLRWCVTLYALDVGANILRWYFASRRDAEGGHDV